ncbi:MAG: hypothetical protein FWC41_10440 [Firmicutes bacterium]|nr:hypothetical protein [Bacillota bacterium]
MTNKNLKEDFKKTFSDENVKNPLIEIIVSAVLLIGSNIIAKKLND